LARGFRFTYARPGLTTRVTPRTQLHLDCAVFNSPKRHATSVGASNLAGPIKTSRSGKPKVQFSLVLHPLLVSSSLIKNGPEQRSAEATKQGLGGMAPWESLKGGHKMNSGLPLVIVIICSGAIDVIITLAMRARNTTAHCVPYKNIYSNKLARKAKSYCRST
jgi:hypothetical protein